MIDPSIISQGMKILILAQDADKISKVLAGNKDVIRDIMSNVTTKKMSEQDIKTFQEFVRNQSLSDMGQKLGSDIDAGKMLSSSPAKFAKALIGGPWAIALDAAGALVGNLGTAFAENMANTARNMSEAGLNRAIGKSEAQKAFYGPSARDLNLAYSAMKYRTKKENTARLLDALSKAAAAVAGTTASTIRTGSYLDKMSEHPLSTREAELARTLVSKTNLDRGQRIANAFNSSSGKRG